MGVVYKAEDSTLKRDVAIKFLPHQIASQADKRERFKIEAQAAAALNHPNIATIYAIEEADDEAFIAMEFIDGKELKERNNAGPLPVDEAMDLATQIAKGLTAAHKKGITHRDIKSANIMLTKDGQVKIMDFGLAKLAGQTLVTKEGTTLGTVAYMSPEQAQAISADHRSDLWSFGVILYEMLTGELPFKADHEAACTYLIMHEQPKMPSAINSSIPHRLDALVMRLLEKDREMRYQSAEEVLEDLQELRSQVKSEVKEDDTKVIAVLPFENISPDKETDYFADGLAEELTVNLSRLKEIKVVSRATSMQYKGTKKDVKTIGRELGARYIMAGSVRKFQDNLRISVQLIDVPSDIQLWAETYKGKLADVFDIQEQVSKQIVDALRLKLTITEKVALTKRPTVNPEAFDCNLRARDFLYQRSKNKLKIAIQLFEKAIELDPRYAGAYAGLGEAYAELYQDFERKEGWLDKSIEFSLKALIYDSTLSEAYAALSLAYFHKKSFDEAITATQKAIELDPNSFIGYWILGRIYHTTDRDREAVDLLQKVITLNPDFYTAYGDLQAVYERLGEKEKHGQTLQAALKVYPRYLSQHPDDARGHMFFALTLAIAGKIDEAKVEGAKAIELSPGIKRDADLETIREEPEYIEMMKGK
jgi:non-specific serine/threonine protein kinase